LPSNSIHSFLPLSCRQVLVGTASGLTVATSDSGSLAFKTYNAVDGFQNTDIRAVISDGKGGFWLGTRGGITHMISQPTGSYQVQNYSVPYGLPSNHMTNAALFKDGGVFFGTDSGLVLFRD